MTTTTAAIPEVPKDLAGGLRALVDRPRLLRPEWQDQQSLAERKGAHPRLREFERLFVKRMANKHGVPLYAHNMVRTAEEQTALYVRGVTRASAGLSPHNHGLAVDIVHSVHHWDVHRHSWLMLGHIGKELAGQLGLKVVWGGDWAGLWDPAHWELADWRSLKGGFPF